MMTLPPTPPAIEATVSASHVGDIHMHEDRSIVLRYRAEINTGTTQTPIYSIAHGYRIIAPDDPDYAPYLAFIGPLQPGQYKPMPQTGPWGTIPKAPRSYWDNEKPGNVRRP